jgi:hypothetical protein
MIRESTKAKYAGVKYGSMTIVEVTRRDPKNKHHYFVLCKCDCGNEKEVRLSGLQQGSTISCGCVGKEIRRLSNIGNTYARLPHGENAKRRLFEKYKQDSKKRGITFDLTFDQFISITGQDCYYCGCKPSKTIHPKNANGGYTYNGVDRTNNEIGYVIDNSVPACTKCNSAKNSITKEMIFKLYHHFFNNN